MQQLLLVHHSLLILQQGAGKCVTGDIGFCGVALEADVANKAAVWVYKRF
jgi:hypothetical protein